MGKLEQTAIANQTVVTERGIAIRGLDELEAWAQKCVAARVVPGGMTVEAAMIAIQAGMERGLGPLRGLQACVVVNNQLSWRVEAAIALIRNSGVLVPGTLKFGCVKSKNPEEAKGWAQAQRVGDREPTKVEFTWDQARRADLTNKDNWKKYPDRMLQWRAVGHLAKDLFSDVLGGFPLAEEAQDYEPSRRQSGATERPPALGAARGPAADPLFATIDGKVVEPEDTPGAQAAPTEAELAAEGDAGEPPFQSHEDADRELAEQEQSGLFGGGA